jgi:hypothetical protein
MPLSTELEKFLPNKFLEVAAICLNPRICLAYQITVLRGLISDLVVQQ